MVQKQTCPHCKGNRYIFVDTAKRDGAARKCPACAGKGYTVRLTK
jgi:DnaJ-class molecular chaperone